MPDRGNIISFDDARRRRASSARHGSKYAEGDVDASGAVSRPSSDDAASGGARPSVARSGARTTGPDSRGRASYLNISSTTRQPNSAPLASARRPSVYDSRGASFTSGRSTRAAERVHEHYVDEDEGEATDADIEAAQKQAQRRERSSRSRSRSKSKASRMYNRQFAGGDAKATGAQDAGPRAAVYKGEMGRSHKRAFEDLGGTDAERNRRARKSVRARSTAADIPGSRVAESVRNLKPKQASRLFIVFAVLVVIVAVGAFLYPSAKEYYTSIREEARLEAQYEAISSHNTELQEQIDSLSTDEGVKDAAREKLGWVESGEQSVVVEGLEDPSEGQDQTQTLYDSAVDVDSITAPDTWYSPVLDVVFGYDPAWNASEDTSSSSDGTSSDDSAASDGTASSDDTASSDGSTSSSDTSTSSDDSAS